MIVLILYIRDTVPTVPILVSRTEYKCIPRQLSLMATSLLDTVTERLIKSGRGLETLSRVCLLGKLAPNQTNAAFGSWCQGQLDAFDGRVTGLLLLMPPGWLFAFEGPPADMSAFMKILAPEVPGQLESVSILSCQEDIRSRCFPHWTCKETSVQRSNYAELESDGSSVPGLLADTVIGARGCATNRSALALQPHAAESFPDPCCAQRCSRWARNSRRATRRPRVQRTSSRDGRHTLPTACLLTSASHSCWSRSTACLQLATSSRSLSLRLT